jgi:hypothetical protein
VTIDNIGQCFGGRGINMTVAETVCMRAVSEVSMAVERCAIGLGDRRQTWDTAVSAVEAAREYLAILNGETSADASPLVSQVTEASITGLKIAGGVAVAFAAAPLVYVLVTSPAAVGLALADTATMAAGRVLTLAIMNPLATHENTSFVVGTTLSIAMAGPANWLRGVATPEGALQTAGDLIVIFVTIRGGGPGPGYEPPEPSPAPQVRAAPPPTPAPAPVPMPLELPGSPGRTRTLRVQGRLARVGNDGVDVRVEHIDEVRELPLVLPERARRFRPAVIPTVELPRDERSALESAVMQIRRRHHPNGTARLEDTHGGLVDCETHCAEFRRTSGGNSWKPRIPGGLHEASTWPDAATAKRLGIPADTFVIDGTGAQYTEYVKGTDVAKGKGLVPIARLRSEQLDEPVRTGIFTREQYERFIQLVVEALRKGPPKE